MQKLGNGDNINNYNYEEIFKKNIDDQDVYEFLRVNEIDYKTAMKFYSEFKMYSEKKDSHQLKYDNGNVSIIKKEKLINPGLTFLDSEQFQDHKTLENTDFSSNKSKATIVAEFIDYPNQGFYLCADNGIGKTTLVTALANSYYKMTKQKTMFVFWPDFIEKTKRFSDKNYLYINKVKHAPRLIIDDLGNESITAWSRDDILHSIIAYRLDRKLPTFITSNYSIEYLQGMYTLKQADSKKTKSIIEKITTLSPYKFISGPNYRKEGENN